MEELPSYFDVDDEPAEPSRPSSALLAPPRPRPRPTAELIPVGVAIQPVTPTTVVVQVVPLMPEHASARLAAWAASMPERRLVAPSGGRTCCAWHVRIDVRGHARPLLPIEVGCAAWSSTRAELHVVPVRAVHDRRRYFRAAHAVLDRLVRDLR